MSHLETTLKIQMKAALIPEPVPEYKFAPDRRWRFDYAWPDRKLAVECEGGTWNGGRHTTGKGFAQDCMKYNRAVVLGWRVLRFTGEQIKSGEALQTIEGFFGVEWRKAMGDDR